MPVLLPLLLTLACSSTKPSTEDLDGDGLSAADGDCWDEAEGPAPGVDGASIYPGAPDPPYDGIDSDCDGADDYDQDGDGWVSDEHQGLETWGVEGSGALPGGDCDDTDPALHPDATETCNDRDDDCNGVVDDAADAPLWVLDEDGDGFAGETELRACEAPDNVGLVGGDCDDLDPLVSPEAEEICNEQDDDCDGEIDEEVVDGTTWYADTDGDGHGDPEAPFVACEAPAEHVALPDDCDDTDEAVSPDAAEQCNGVDDDCDELVDEDGAATTWYADGDGDGYAAADAEGVEACAAPGEDWALVLGDCDDGDPLSSPEGIEVCGGGDEDCDGTVDEEGGVADGTTWIADGDGDGYGAIGGETVVACTAPIIGEWSTTADDCDDRAAAIHPGAEEVCNGDDDNCDGTTDDDAVDRVVAYTDADRDGYGDDATETTVCSRATGQVAVGGDCDDDAFGVNPGATEVCNDRDDDCDGEVDTDATDRDTVYTDADGDGYGDDATETTTCELGSTDVRVGGDCDDGDDAVHPGAVELCNEVDDDCDGTVDDDARGAISAWADADGDGYGDPAAAATLCEAEDGYALNDEDCDDTSDAVFPGATELCNETDDDCDGSVDEEAADASRWYVDEDGDGYGGDDRTEAACEPEAWHTSTAGDCDDGDAAVNPDATEVCNGKDDDCDAVTDPDWFSSDLSSDPDELSINGDASYRSSSDYIRLTDSTDNEYGSAFLVDLVPGDRWAVSFDLAIWDQEYTYYGADGMTFAFLDDDVAATWVSDSSGSDLGVAGAAGWAIEFDNYDSGDAYGDVDGEHVALVRTSDMLPLVSEADPPDFDYGSWMLVEIVYDAGTVEVWMDGEYVLSGTLDSDPPEAWRLGWTAATGGRNEAHGIDDLWVGCPTE